MKLAGRLSLLLLLCSASLVSSACHVTDATEVDEEALVSTSEAALAADPTLRERVIAFAKHRIREISRANQTRTDNVAQVTAELQPYIDLLVRAAPRLSQEQTLQRLQGPWYSLWTNQPFRGATPNLARTFQVVFQGHYYNLFDSPAPQGGTVIGALRGAYAPVPDAVAIRFTRNAFVPGSLAGKTGAEAAALAAGIENRSIPSIQIPGPIGITGVLGTVYVDSTLRISTGFQPPIFDDNGNVTIPGDFGLLFVLERLEGTVP